MNKKTLLTFALLVIIIGVAIASYAYKNDLTSENQVNTVPQTLRPNTNNGTFSSSSSSESYIPAPINRSSLENGRYTENRSPDGKFISHGFDNEQGDSGVYLTSSDGTEVTATYCGFFKEWSPDSKKITVFVPYECGRSVSENETFELHVDGSVSK